jgi:hypothetical protein
MVLFDSDGGAEQTFAAALDFNSQYGELEDMQLLGTDFINPTANEYPFLTPSFINEESVPSANEAIENLSLTSSQSAVYRDIEEVERSMRALELSEAFDQNSATYLGLKLRKTKLYISARSSRISDSRESPRDNEIIELELQEVLVLLEIRSLQRTSEDLDEDEDYQQLKLRRIQLRKELGTSMSQSVLALPSAKTSFPPQVQDVGRKSTAVESHNLPPNSTDHVAPFLIDFPANEVLPGNLALEPTILKLINLSSRKRPHVEGVPENMQFVMATDSEAIKRLKRTPLTEDEKVERKLVLEKGGQCLSCRFSKLNVWRPHT